MRQELRGINKYQLDNKIRSFLNQNEITTLDALKKTIHAGTTVFAFLMNKFQSDKNSELSKFLSSLHPSILEDIKFLLEVDKELKDYVMKEGFKVEEKDV